MLALTFSLAALAADDPFLWLEEVTGERALEWVEAHNATTTEAVQRDPGFDAMQQRIRGILDSDERIAYVSKLGERWVNFWRDAEHPRGLWRSTTLEAYRAGEPDWQILLDLDALAAEEGENWVWSGATCRWPERERCLVRLSRGGADANVVREFDVGTGAFVEGGFALPEAKSRVGWVDADTVFVGTDFGEGSLTDSGYPRIIKRWRRGTPIDQAETVFEGQAADVSVGFDVDPLPGHERQFVIRSPGFFETEVFEVTSKGLVRVDKPPGARFTAHDRYAFLRLRDDWTVGKATYVAGSLIVTDHDRLMKGKPKFTVLFEPTETTSLRGWSLTRNRVVLQVLDDVKTRLEVLTPGRKDWARAPLSGSDLDRVSASAVDRLSSDEIFVYRAGFLTPSTFAYRDLATDREDLLAQLPAFFETEGLEVSQRFATSKDGTRIPYFLVAPTTGGDGPVPTLMSGYGGFEIPRLAGYSAAVGAGWLERGGAYVVANIRGGGEYGPRWHQAALRDKRHKAYEDFAAVGEDLVASGLTTSAQLGIVGGSNGGLLMGNMYTTYPDHWGAIVCQVPLLDMKRYTKLLAGASWMGEYGDPDNPEDWAFLKAYSPYHNLDPDETGAPPLLVTTSTRDDRVHPGHARKFVAALEALGRDDVWYYENIEGGHRGAANNEQRAFMTALAYTFTWNTLTDTWPEVVSARE
ncbi:MAG: prolyl oligopeptidase family serine peptidase [Myxococcota bacterium]